MRNHVSAAAVGLLLGASLMLGAVAAAAGPAAVSDREKDKTQDCDKPQDPSRQTPDHLRACGQDKTGDADQERDRGQYGPQDGEQLHERDMEQLKELQKESTGPGAASTTPPTGSGSDKAGSGPH